MAESQSFYRDKSDFLQKLNENYDQITEINKGGGGIIYAGVHRRLGRKVVLKKIKENHIGLIGRDREMKILMNLRHTYLPRILDFWSYGDEVYTVMEYIEGKSCKELLDKGIRFTEKDVIRLTRQLTEVLVYLHEAPEPIIHCDIKPANIMITPPDPSMSDEQLPSNGNICLIDFNVSQKGDDESIGYTAGYAPVEQLISAERGKRKRLQAQQAAAQQASAPQYTPQADEDQTFLDDERTYLDDDRTDMDPNRTFLDETAVQPERPVLSAPMPVSASAPSAAASLLAEQALKLEKLYGSLSVDVWTDIYSACATMYHLLTGHKPNPCYEKQIPIENDVPDVNDAFAKILEHGMEQNPAKRFASARQMLRSLNQLAKSTKRYRHMRAGQDFTIILLCLLFACGIVSVWIGGQKKLETHVDGILTEAQSLYLAGEYSDAEQLLSEKILRSPYPVSDMRQADAYRILGDCALQTEQYPAAVEAYRTALMMGEALPELYRDYGIALARSGDLRQAEECLAQAKALRLTSDSLLLLEGELANAGDDLQAGEAAYRQCLAESKNPSVLARAGIGLDLLIERLGTESKESYAGRIADLDALRTALADAPQNQFPVCERLAQTCIDANQFSPNPSYIHLAVLALDTIIEHGYGTLTEWISRAVCAQSIGLYEDAKAQLLEASELFPDEYLIFKRLAFLEIEIQHAESAENRDYGTFASYYAQSMSLYEKETHTEQDMEMEYLQKTYEEIIRKGWLDP